MAEKTKVQTLWASFPPRTISSHRLRLDCLSGWHLEENEADAAYQAADGFARKEEMGRSI
jgi:hypothetical protein